MLDIVSPSPSPRGLEPVRDDGIVGPGHCVPGRSETAVRVELMGHGEAARERERVREMDGVGWVGDVRMADELEDVAERAGMEMDGVVEEGVRRGS